MASQSSKWAEMTKLVAVTQYITGYKTKLLKHVRAGQLCKMHMLIGFSGKYAIKFVLATENKKIIIII